VATEKKKKKKLAKSSDEFLSEVRELHELEDQKRKQPISTGRYHELAESVTEKSREIMYRARLQEDLGDDTDTGDASIQDIQREG
jgi:hypothetical protein